MKLTDKEIYSTAANDLGVYAVLQSPDYDLAKHIHLLADRLESVEKGKIRRLGVFMPPQNGKTKLTSIKFPAWCLGRNPNINIIAIAYNQERANDIGRQVRNQFTDSLHKSIFPNCRISEDSAASNRFNTNQNGSYYAVGVGGPITGRGAHILIIDDPIKGREDADSPVQRRKLIEWYQSVAVPRLTPTGSIILIQTRWHQNDLAGWILRGKEKWSILNFPALAEQDDPLGRKLGEALWPKYYPQKRLLEIKGEIGDRAFGALYQQRPASIEGNLFNEEWWQYYGSQPVSADGVLQSWDCGYEQGKDSSYSVCQTWTAKDGHFYLLNQLRERLTYPDLLRAVKMQAQCFNPEKILIEQEASGRALIQDLYDQTRLPIQAVSTKNKSKESRAYLITDLIEAGRVWLPKNAGWLDGFIDEASHFPHGRFNDQVDAMTMALQFMKTNQLNRERTLKFKRPSTGRPDLYSSGSLVEHLVNPNSGFFDRKRGVRVTFMKE